MYTMTTLNYDVWSLRARPPLLPRMNVQQQQQQQQQRYNSHERERRYYESNNSNIATQENVERNKVSPSTVIKPKPAENNNFNVQNGPTPVAVHDFPYQPPTPKVPAGATGNQEKTKTSRK